VLSYVRNSKGFSRLPCPHPLSFEVGWWRKKCETNGRDGDQGTDWKDTDSEDSLGKISPIQVEENFQHFVKKCAERWKDQEMPRHVASRRNSAAVEQGSQVDFMCQLFKKTKTFKWRAEIENTEKGLVVDWVGTQVRLRTRWRSATETMGWQEPIHQQ
jgi:hypothetical protein